MTKKLFVVLVLITAMLVSFSLVMAAKKAPRGIPQPYVKQTIGQQQTATPVPRGSLTQALEASLLVNPISTAAAYPDKVPGYGPPQHSYEGVLILQGGEDCASATVIGSLPHTSTGTTEGWADDYNEDCPYTGSTAPDVVYSYTPGADEAIDIDLYGSSYDTKVFVYENDCVPPYYACNDDYYSDYTSAIFNLDIYAGNTYYIVIDGYSGGDFGDYLLNMSLYVPCDVVCPGEGIPEDEPVCTDDWEDIWNGGCNSDPNVFEDVNCGDIICGTSGTYDYSGSNHRDTDWYRVVMAEDGDLSWKVVGEFPVLIFIIDAGSENCEDYTILGNVSTGECDTAFLSFPVTAGVYWLWVGPSVFSGIDCGVEYVGIVGCEGGEPTDQCQLQHDNGSASGYFGGWNVGDQSAAYFDPATECVDCDPVYPLHITEVQGYFYDHAGVGTVDIIVHFYEAGDPCDGPGVEIYSFAATVTDFYQNDTWATIPVPDLFCLEDDFFLAVEYNSGATGTIPSLLTDSNSPADTCIQWNEYLDYGWIEWWDFWAPPIPGWLMLRATGTCADEACDPGTECYMFQGSGVIASYWSGWGPDDGVAKYYDPEEYCTPTVYPVRIDAVDVVLYDYAGAETATVEVAIYIECSEPCDGPGTEIYRTDPITVTTFYPNLATITLPDLVCIYEPFFVGIHYPNGVPGTTPSVAFDNGVCDTCHAWMWYESAGYSPPWYEWADFWAPPLPGCPMIYVMGYTESPACDIPQCDTTLEYLYGSPTVAYYFKQPGNEQFMNMQFEMPSDHSGRLEGFQVAFYDYEGNPSYGTPDPDLYVWLSDGTFPLDNNPPFQAIAEFHKDFTEIVWFPGYTEFDAYAYNLVFDPGELFHIGGSHAHEAGDTLAWLGDAGDPGRASSWDGSAWGDFGGYLFVIHAIICPFAPENPTFSMRCTPSVGYATPGDPPVDVYQVEIGAVIGYAENVTLSLLDPGVDITATFNPNGIPPDFVSDVAIAVGSGVPYGDHTLTFQGVGDDAQTKTCDVTLKVQPPYDEGYVDFFHGRQATTNFGALANDSWSDNFLWYGMEYLLYDGSIISAVPGDPQNDHMALDMYDCEHVGFIPNQHMIITDIAGCVGSEYEELYGEMSYSEFYTTEDVISCEWDSLFIIGLRDVECTDFSIKIKIYYNPTETDIPELWAAVFEDWDVADYGNNSGEMDPDHNLMYMYDVADPAFVFGIMKVPFYDEPMQSMVFVYNVEEVYPTGTYSLNCGGDPGPSYMFDTFMVPGLFRNVGDPPWNEGPDDHSIFMASQPFSLNPGEKHIEIWIDFGRNLGDGMTWEQWYKKILRYVGMYRGDVNASDTLDLPSLDVSDLVYLINYLYHGGPAPLPFADQGNVDGKGPYAAFVGDNLDYLCPKNNVDVQDLVYLLNFIYRNGPPPVDYVRYIEQFWSRPSLFTNPLWN